MYWNKYSLVLRIVFARLTLTWDVLKYVHWQAKKNISQRLTLTWDVLKFCYSFNCRFKLAD